MRILVVSQMYPNADNPHFGVFIQREVESLSHHCEQKVIAPRPWIPWKLFNKKVSKRGRLDPPNGTKVEVQYPAYFPLPGPLFMPIKGFWFLLFTYNLVRRVKKTFDFDIIHAHNVYPEGFCAVLLKGLFKKPVVISLRGNDINRLPKNPILRRMICYALRQADKILTVSKSLKDRAVALGVDDVKFSIMPKGVDMVLFRPMDVNRARTKLGLPLDRIIILSVGWIIPRKNPFAFTEAASTIRPEERDRYLFVWVGEGPLRNQVEQVIQKQGLHSMFQLEGRVDPSQIPLWMNAADIFVLVSFSEGMPNVLYEAMACGASVIASNVDGAAEVIEHGQNGLLVSPHDHPKITEQIMLLAADEAMRKRLGRKARVYMERKNLDWENNALWLMEKYSSVL